jgi:hypothetical protein
MQTWQIVAICAAVIVVIAAIAYVVYQQRRSRHLRAHFGSEYDRTISELGDRRRGESELARRENRIRNLDIRPISTSDRVRFTEQWQLVQAQFVDDPEGAVEKAEQLVGEIMSSRGYASQTFEERIADVSAAYPDRARDYRTASDIAHRQHHGIVTTEELRKAFVCYRALFNELLGGGYEELKRAS